MVPISADVPPADLITATKAAQEIERHVGTIYRWINDGHLSAWKGPGKNGKGRVFVSQAELRALLRPVPVRRLPAAPGPAQPVPAAERRRRAAVDAHLDAAGL